MESFFIECSHLELKIPVGFSYGFMTEMPCFCDILTRFKLFYSKLEYIFQKIFVFRQKFLYI